VIQNFGNIFPFALDVIPWDGKTQAFSSDQITAKPGFHLIMVTDPAHDPGPVEFPPALKEKITAITIDDEWNCGGRAHEITDAVKQGQSVLVEGPAASGKTGILRHAAGPEARHVIMGSVTGVEDLLGHYVPDSSGSTKWQNGPLPWNRENP